MREKRGIPTKVINVENNNGKEYTFNKKMGINLSTQYFLLSN